MELTHKQERGDSALESLEHELYDPRKKTEEQGLHHVRDRKTLELPVSWGDNTPIITQGKEEGGMSFGAKFLLISIFLFVSAISFFAWKVFSSRNVVSGANIDMTLDIAPYTEGGESTPLKFSLFNRNTAPLQSASIMLSYKQGVGSQDEQEKIYEKRDIGIVNSNDYKYQDFNIILYGSEAEQRDLTIKLEYKVIGSNATFSKIITTSTILKTPPVTVHIDGPKILSIGQQGTFTFTVKNNSATTSLPTVLQIALPNTFTTIETEPKANSRSTTWNIPSIKSGDSVITTITGSLTGTQGETVTMKALIGQEGNSKGSVGIVYSSQTTDIKLRSSPLNFSLTMDTDGGATEKLRYGDTATLILAYANTSDIPLQDVVITLFLDGDAPLYKKIDPTNGYYDSEKKTITWTKANVPELALLAPNANGTMRIVVPIVVQGTNSPLFKVNVRGNAATKEKEDVVALLSKKWAVEGSATLNRYTTYKNSPFVSTGPIPPVPNTDTSYTAHLIVSAQNALTNARVSFILPSYVTWRNISSDASRVSYDERSRTVTWLIGDIASEKTVALDVSLMVRPSQSHVGQSPAITSGIVLEADESVSKAHIRTTVSALTTFLSNENWDTNPSRVVDR